MVPRSLVNPESDSAAEQTSEERDFVFDFGWRNGLPLR
jgi:hypothetical protein